MELSEVQSTLTEIKDQVSTIEEMIDDLNACKNEKSKTYLLAAICKFTQ